jgi:hypothetical protein
MLRFKTPLFLLLGLITPVCASAHYCIRVSGGFGNGGTSFIGRGFTVPAAGTCARWTGFLKTATSVVAVSTGTGCTSANGKVLEVTIFSSDPSFFGAGGFSQDHIKLCPAGPTDCPIGGGVNSGNFFSGPAAPQVCTTELLRFPAIHD